MAPWSWGFRAGLRDALTEWEAEGLISAEAARTLRDRYALEGDEAAKRANLAIYLLGALLVFGGLVSLVAWNWSALPSAAKVAIGLSVMVGTETAGFWLGWVRQGQLLLGHTLVFLGALSFGANLGLLAQAFHFEPGREGFWVWALASTVLSAALRSVPCGVLGAVVAFAWVLGEAGAGWPFGFLLPHALWLTVLFYGLLLRSSALFGVALVGGGVIVSAFALEASNALGLLGVFHIPLAFSVGLIGLGAVLPEEGRGLGRLGGGLVVLFAFLSGFSEIAVEVARESQPERLGSFLAAGGPPLLLGALVFLVPSGDVRNGLLAGLGAALLLILSGFAGKTAVLLAAHLTLVGRVVWDLRRSLSDFEREPFWSALLLGVATIVARFFEVRAGLLEKAALFILAGIVVLFLGHRFEQKRKEARRAF